MIVTFIQRVRIGLLLLLVTLMASGYAQDPVQDVLNLLVDFEGGAIDGEGLERLEVELNILLDNPLDINTASADALADLKVINDREIQAILRYRTLMRGFSSLDELNGVEGLSPAKASAIRPFLRVAAPLLALQEAQRGKGNGLYLPRWYIRGQGIYSGESGYVDSLLRGSVPQTFTLHYREGTERSAGVQLRQQEGEQWRHERGIYLPDQINFHAYTQSPRARIQQLAIGDYSINMGEGLIAYQGFRVGKSAMVNHINVGGRKRLSPYRSSGSFNHMRGLALSGDIGGAWGVMCFASYRRLDATWTFSSDSSAAFLKTINRSGLHDTDGTRSRRGNAQLVQLGASISYRAPSTSVYLNTLLEGMAYRGNRPYSTSVQSGQNRGYASLSFQQYVGSFLFFGEEALRGDGAYALLNGLTLALAPSLTVSVLVRDYSPEYSSIWANAFRSSTYVGNERGIYFGMDWRLLPGWAVQMYSDQWMLPKGNSSGGLPVRGREAFWRLTHRRRKHYEIYGQLRYRTVPESQHADDQAVKYTSVVQNNRWNLRIHATYILNKQLTWKARVEGLRLHTEGVLSNGYLLYQDLTYKPIRFPLTLKVRATNFYTPDYQTRLYAFENGISSGYTLPFYYGRGRKLNVLIRYKPFRNANLDVRMAIVNRRVGAGELTTGIDTQWRFQYRF